MNAKCFLATKTDNHPDLWVAFAANTAVDPVAQGYTWEKYSPNTTSMALFAANGTVVQSVPGSYFDFQCDGVMAL